MKIQIERERIVPAGVSSAFNNSSPGGSTVHNATDASEVLFALSGSNNSFANKTESNQVRYFRARGCDF